MNYHAKFGAHSLTELFIYLFICIIITRSHQRDYNSDIGDKKNKTILLSKRLILQGLNLAVQSSRSTQSDVRRYFFSQRVVNEWNALPNYVKHANSVNDFKNKFDNFSTIT